MSENQNRTSNTWTRMNAIRHFIFGVLLLFIAVYVLQHTRVGPFDFGTTGSYVFGGLLIVYGIFRLWRGFADLRELRNGE